MEISMSDSGGGLGSAGEGLDSIIQRFSPTQTTP